MEGESENRGPSGIDLDKIKDLVDELGKVPSISLTEAQGGESDAEVPSSYDSSWLFIMRQRYDNLDRLFGPLSVKDSVKPLGEIYQPLGTNEIRLVIFKERRRPLSQEIPECVIARTLVNDQTPIYQALSYEWGQASNNDPEILMNGVRVRVRKNLKDALFNIRSYYRCLWIDAVCINQTNNQERTSQVQMMGSIYSKADEVCVWLGPASNDSHLAIQHIESQHNFYVRDLNFPLSASLPTDSLLVDVFPSIQRLLSRSYWHRVWVIQEIQLAKSLTFYCGTYQVSDEALEHFFRRLKGFLEYKSSSIRPSWGDLPQQVYNSIGFAAHIKKRYERRVKLKRGVTAGLDLRHWLFDCCLAKNFQCTEPRDFVYAFQSISANCLDDQLSADYDALLEQVFLDTLLLCHKRGRIARVEKADMMWAKLLARKLGLDWVGDDIPTLLKTWEASVEEETRG